MKWNKTVKDYLSQCTVRFKKAKLVQSKITTTKDWKEKITKLLTAPVADIFIENKWIEDDSLLFLGYGDKKEAVSQRKNMFKYM